MPLDSLEPPMTAAADRPPCADVDAGTLLALADKLTGANQNAHAAELYRQWLRFNHTALDYIIRFNLGVTLSQLNALTEAEAEYRRAIEQKADFVQAWFNLGTVQERLGQPQAALDTWQSLLDKSLVTADSNRELYLMVVNALGRLCEEQRQFATAEQHLRASLAAEPMQPKVIQHWVHLRQKQCRWPVYTEVEGISIGDLQRHTSPLAMLSVTDDTGTQLAIASHFAHERVNQRVPELVSPQHRYTHDKLRIGFLSSDFCLHAVSLLTVELFELLDHAQFELYGFCWSREDGSALRARVIAAMDHFMCIGTLDDAVAAQLIRQNEIDILIDLQGLTSGARPNILAWRPAPIQMTYLGFPGPTGLPCIDYVIADRFLIPETEKPFYSETPLYLPRVYQSSDRQRPVGALPTRAQCQLPEDSFVFCCFNNNYKFTPAMFDSWMHILDAVPDSVLWLLADNRWAQDNLTAQARATGIDTSRLIFAPRVAPQDYLARYTAADLFLDAFPFNAGTTANDALWMGLPVLTRSGHSFASRMAGSLLTALNLPELITHTQAEYEKRAIALATDTECYRDIKQRLDTGRTDSPLFDMPQFVRDFGEALQHAQRHTSCSV